MNDPRADREIDIRAYLSKKKKEVDKALDHLLPTEDTYPKSVNQAMRYSVFAGGKRLRPILAIAAGECLDVDPAAVSRLACALEMIHTYSLIHDDLPAMDNDDFRRGNPSCHRKYGEGIAILAGNGLMNLAFQLFTEIPDLGTDPGLVLITQRYLCQSVGTEGGVIAGQVVDLLTQGKTFDETDLNYIHTCKTAALIRASVVCTGLLSGADPAVISQLEIYGLKAGLAFQIVDDILDIIGDKKSLGKTIGKDEKEKKATYPALFGLEESRKKAEVLIAEAENELHFLGSRGRILRELARFITVRRY
jgi:geranylgeranyl diphosphate synthase type II